MPDSADDRLDDRVGTRFYPPPELIERLGDQRNRVPATSSRTRSALAIPAGLGIAAVVLVALVAVGGPQLLRGPAAPVNPTSNQPATAYPVVVGPDSVVLMRTESGPFDLTPERTVEGHPNVIVFDEGLIVVRDPRLAVDEPRRYLSLQLTESERQDVQSAIGAANLTTLEIDVDAARGCFDGTTALFAVATDRETFTEVPARCLLTIVGLASPDPAIYGQGLVDLDAMLQRLTSEAVERGTVWHGEIPTVLVAPGIGG